MAFTETFGGTTIYPSDVSYRAISLSANQTLAWPLEVATSGNVVAQIMDVTPSAGSFTITMPPANEASPGETALFFNAGSFNFTVADNAGNTIVAITPGLAYQVYLRTNTTVAGTWRTTQFGAGTSSATAGSLIGAGIKAINTTLNQSMAVTSLSVNYTAGAADRSAAFLWTGGAGTITLPAASTVGNDWFFHIRNGGTGAISLATTGGELINGTATVDFNPGDSAIIVCDGTGYFTIGFGQAPEFLFDYVSIDLTSQSSPYTLSGSNLNRIAYQFSGTLTTNMQIIVPATIQQYWVGNFTTGGSYTVTVKTSAGTGTVVPRDARSILYCNGTDVVNADTGGISIPILVSQGGTGATNASQARTNLGATSIGNALFIAVDEATARNAIIAAKSGANSDITSLTGLTTPLSVPQGGTGVATFTANGIVYGSGASALAVTVAGTTGQVLVGNTGTAPSWSTLSGIGVTSFSAGSTGLTPSTATTGIVTLAGTLIAANGGTGFASYAVGDLLFASTTTVLSKLADVATGNALISGGIGVAPSYGKIGLTTHVSGTLDVGNGGTGATTLTGYVKGSGTSAFTASATIPATDISSGAALTKTDDTNVTLTLGGSPTTALLAATSITAGWTGQLSVSRGGTGQSSYTDGQLLIGNTTGNTLTKTTLTAGTNVTITNGSGAITINAADQFVGTVTSVSGTGTVSGLTLTGTVTTSGNLTLGGTLAVTPSNFASQTANTVLAAPNGAAGVPTFRAIVAADVPTLNQNTTGTASNVTGTVAVGNGGTGTATAFTAGSVVFAGASGVYSQDNANLFWDDTNNRLGIGTATPSDKLHIVDESNVGVRFTEYNNAEGAVFRLSAARGTLASPTAVTTDSAIFGFRGFGYTSAGAFSGAVAQINARAAENFTATAQGTYLTFITTPTGSTTAAERMRIDASGNVGIGTSSPSSKLDVNGAITSSGSTNPYLALNNGTATSYVQVTSGILDVRVGGANPITFNTNSTERMRIDASGNIGIGTTAPQSKMEIRATSGGTVFNALTLSNYVGASVNTGVALYFDPNGAGSLARAASIQSVQATSGNYADLRFFTAASDTPAERMRITTAGNVGVGEPTPNSKLTVGANPPTAGAIGAVGASGGVSLALSDNVNSSLYIRHPSAGVAMIGTDAGGQLVFASGTTEKMRMDSSGNLLVGTTATTNAAKMLVQFSSVSNGLYLDETSNTSGTQYMRFSQSSTVSGSITRVGTTAAVLYNTTSDSRAKHDIVDAPEASSLIDAIQVRSFKWNADDSEYRYGFIAQELLEVAPEAVHQPSDPEEMMGVDYSKLVPMLVKELQSVRARLAILEGNQ